MGAPDDRRAWLRGWATSAADGGVLRLQRRLVAALLAAALISLAVQIPGLLDEGGVLSISATMAALREASGASGWLHHPTPLWWGAPDLVLYVLAWAGAVAGGVGALAPSSGRASRWGLGLALLAFYSLSVAQPLLLGWQPDVLLIQLGVLLLVARPDGRSPGIGLLIHLLLIKVYGEMALHRIAGAPWDDNAWIQGSALGALFETTIMPGAAAWHLHHLPAPVLAVMTWALLAVELVLPTLALLWRPARRATLWLLTAVQLLHLISGNYGVFTWALLVAHLSLLPERTSLVPEGTVPWRVRLRASAGAVLVLAWSVQLAGGLVEDRATLPVRDWLHSVRISVANPRFRQIPPSRTVWLLEVSEELAEPRTWRTLQARGGIGDPASLAGWHGLHHPRLATLFWFGTLRSTFPPPEGGPPPPLDSTIAGLPAGPALHALGRLICEAPERAGGHLAPELGRPRAVRLAVARYRFTTPRERERTGHYWHVEPLGLGPILNCGPSPEPRAADPGMTSIRAPGRPEVPGSRGPVGRR